MRGVWQGGGGSMGLPLVLLLLLLYSTARVASGYENSQQIIQARNDDELDQALSAARASQGLITIQLTGPSGYTLRREWVLKGISLAMEGAGATPTRISAHPGHRHFSLHGSAVSLKNVVLFQGTAESQGGSLYVEGGSLHLVSSSLVNNKVLLPEGRSGQPPPLVQSQLLDSGGAVYAKDAEVRLLQASFQDNNAPGRGGALAMDGGRLEGRQAAFHSNTAAGEGGAVWVRDLRSVSLDSSHFHNNMAIRSHGGALWVGGTKGDVTSCVFEGNSAALSGGALHLSDGAHVSAAANQYRSNQAKAGGAVALSGDAKLEARAEAFEQGTGPGRSRAIFHDPQGRASVKCVDCRSDGEDLQGHGVDEKEVAEVQTGKEGPSHRSPSALSLLAEQAVAAAAEQAAEEVQAVPEAVAAADSSRAVTMKNVERQLGTTTYCNYTVMDSSELNTALTALEEGATPCDAFIFFNLSSYQVYFLSQVYVIDSSAITSLTFDARPRGDDSMVILVAASGQRHFELSNVDFAAYNIVFLNGTATDQYGGGSILAQSGSSLTLSQVVFVDNRATWDGYYDAELQSAADYGGGGAVSLLSSQASMDSVGFINNTVYNGFWGGGLRIGSSCGKITCTNCHFSGNAASSGGAVAMVPQASSAVYTTKSATFTSSLFQDNTADADGAGLYYYCDVDGVDYVVYLASNNFTSNKAGWRGGGFFLNSWQVSSSMSYNIFDSNTAIYGGGVFLAGGGSDTSTHPLSTTTFYNNQASGSGGAIASVTPFFCQYCTVIGNTAGDIGGGIYVNYSTSSYFYDSTISENSAGDSCGGLAILGGFCEVSTGMLEYNTAVNGGGAMCAMGSARVSISSTNLKHNSAGLKGGAVLVTGSEFNSSSDTYDSNSALLGGAIYSAAGGSARSYWGAFTSNSRADLYREATATFYCLQPIYTPVTSNNTVNCGGTSGAPTSSPTSSPTPSPTFYSNPAPAPSVDCNATVSTDSELSTALSVLTDASSSGCSAFITFSGSQTTYTLTQPYYVYSSYVSALTLDGRGVSGGVTLQASSESLHFFFSYVDLTAYDITFQGGSSSVYAGSIGMYFGTLRLNGVVFYGNSESGTTTDMTTSGGGALRLTYTTATLTNVTFRNNSALTYGGAMLSVAAYVTFTGCKFISNAAGMGGGAMAVVQASGTMDITYCVFRDNSAGQDGGALYNSRDSYMTRIPHTLFINNQAGFRGGALFIPYLMSSLSLATANFTHNTAVYGGAIYAGSDHSSYYIYSSLYLSFCYFVSNTATQSGGAINAALSMQTKTVVLRGNTAGKYGGGVYTNSSSYAYLLDSTFVRNQAAYGGGVAMRASKGSVYSCNLTANTATTKGGGIVVLDGSNVAMTSTSLGGNNGAASGGGVLVWNSLFNSTYNTYKGNKASLGSGLATTVGGYAKSMFDTFSGNQDDDLYESSQSSLSCYNTGTVLSRNTVNCSATMPTPSPSYTPAPTSATPSPTVACSPYSTTTITFNDTGLVKCGYSVPSGYYGLTWSGDGAYEDATYCSSDGWSSKLPYSGRGYWSSTTGINLTVASPGCAFDFYSARAAPTTWSEASFRVEAYRGTTRVYVNSNQTMTYGGTTDFSFNLQGLTSLRLCAYTCDEGVPFGLQTLTLRMYATTSTPTSAPTSSTPKPTTGSAPTTAPTAGKPTNVTTPSPTAPTQRPTMAPTTRSPTTAPTAGAPMYPQVFMVATNSSASAISVKVGVNRAGYLWCVAQTSSTSPGGSSIKSTATSMTITRNATYTMTGLTAFTRYYVFCYTEDSEDTSVPANVLPDSLVSATARAINTTCCYSLTLPTLPTTLYTSTASSALTITSPAADVSVAILTRGYTGVNQAGCVASRLAKMKANSTSITISPSNVLSFTSSSLSNSFALYATTGGCYSVTYQVQGTNAAKFYSPSNTSIYLLTSESVPSAPLLSSVQFSSSGSSLTFTFDSSTDYGSQSGVFACSKLVWFLGVSGATCSWSSYTQLLASLGSSASVVPGNTAMLLGSKIKARCASGSTLCSQYTYSATANVTITKPTSPLVPSPVLSYASTISSCAAMVVDASGSTGSGGRSTYAYWSVSSITGANTTSIDLYLSRVNPPTTFTGSTYGVRRLSFPSSFIEPGVYMLQLTLVNFLGSSSSAFYITVNFLGSSASSSAFYITVTADALPSVSIDGGSTKTMYRASALSLQVKASLSSCSRAKGLTYRWVESSKTVSSTSKDPRYFTAAANTLTAGRKYNFTVVVRDTLGNSNNATATVTVLQSALIAAIGGGNRTIGTGSLTLNAGSYSKDPDVSSGGSTTLSYSWSCIRGGSLYGTSCGLTLASTSSVTTTLSTSGIYIFSVTVSKDSRSASASVYITAIDSSPPAVSITPLSVIKVSTSSRLVISSTVTPANSGYSFNMTWSLSSGSLAVSSLSAAASTSLTATSTASSYKFVLVIKPDSLVEKATYVLKLSAQQLGATGYSTLTFLTNAPPSSGTLDISPSSGYALTDSFTFTASSWVDDASDYPLYYSFYYIVGTSGSETLLIASTRATLYEGARLPQGDDVNRAITGVVYVADTYGASARATYAATVVKPQISVADLQNKSSSLLEDALSSSQTDVVFGVVGAGVGILNNKTCDDAATCQGVRTSFLTYLTNASALSDDTDKTALAQQASVLSSVASSPDQLSSDGQALAVSLVSSIASSSSSAGITTDAAAAVGSTIRDLGITTDAAAAMGSTISSLFSSSALSSDEHASSLSSAINGLSSSLWVDAQPGEEASTISTDNLKLSSQVSYAEDLEGKGLSPPGSSNGMTLPGTGISDLYEVSTGESVSTAIVSLPNTHNDSSGGSKSVTSDVLRLVLASTSSRRRRRRLSEGGTEVEETVVQHTPLQPRRRELSSSSSSYITVVMQTKTAQTYTSTSEQVSLNCTWDEIGIKYAKCASTGKVFNITCTGRKQLMTHSCSRGNGSVCAYWDGSQWATDCFVYQVTPTNTTCHCYNLSAALSSSSSSYRRRLSDASDMAADLALVVGSIATNALATFATPLSLSVLSKNMVVFITVGAFLGMTALLVLYGYWQDAEDKKHSRPPRRTEKHKAAEEESAAVRKLHSPTDAGEAVSPLSVGFADNVPSATDDSPRKDSHHKTKPKHRRPSDAGDDPLAASSSSSSSSDGSELEWAIEEEAEMNEATGATKEEKVLQSTLPDFAKARSYWSLAVRVLGRHHDWFSVVCVYSRLMPRGIRVAVIATATLTVMFLNALLYDLAFPDRTPCASYSSKASCESEPSMYYKGKQNCNWDSTAQACSFNQPSNDFFTIILVSVATTIFSYPVGMVSSMIFAKLLLPPTTGTAAAEHARQHRLRELERRKHEKHGLQSWREKWAKRVKKKKRLAKEADRVMAEVILIVQKQREELVEFINNLQIKIFRDVAEARSAELQSLQQHGPGVSVNGLNQFLRSFENKEDQRKLDELLAFLRVFEKRWHMDERGRFKEDTWWERLTRTTFLRRLRRELMDDLKAVRAIEEQLKKVKNPKLRETRLLEYARIDFLSPAERSIYLRNKIYDPDEDLEISDEVAGWAKGLGWALLSIFNMGLGYYICMFGVRKGASTTRAWLCAFVYGSAQDIFISAPLTILWFYFYLPLHIRFRIRSEIDGAAQDPFIFTDYLPPGPAARVILRHPSWGSKVPIDVLSPSRAPVSPLSSNGVLVSKLSPRTERAVAENFAERYREHFRRSEQVAHGLLFVASFMLVTAFMMLPDSAQDMVVGQVVPIVVGGIAYGFQLLYQLQQWFIAVPLGGLVVLLAVVTLGAAALRVVNATRRRHAPAAVLSPIGIQAVRSPDAVTVMADADGFHLNPRTGQPLNTTLRRERSDRPHATGQTTPRRHKRKSSRHPGEQASPTNSSSRPPTPTRGPMQQDGHEQQQEEEVNVIVGIWNSILALANTTISTLASTAGTAGSESPTAGGGKEEEERRDRRRSIRKKKKGGGSKVRQIVEDEGDDATRAEEEEEDAAVSPRARPPRSPRSPGSSSMQDSPNPVHAHAAHTPRSPRRSPKSPGLRVGGSKSPRTTAGRPRLHMEVDSEREGT